LSSSQDADYTDKLSFLSDLELVREQDENYVEFFFFLVQYESMKCNPSVRSDTIREFELSFLRMQKRIRAVKAEIRYRDSVLEDCRTARESTVLSVNREIS
jgi:hypothetical protein